VRGQRACVAATEGLRRPTGKYVIERFQVGRSGRCPFVNASAERAEQGVDGSTTCHWQLSVGGERGKRALDVESGVVEGAVEIVEEVTLVGESVERADGAERA
jgi:hypothetical protein